MKLCFVRHGESTANLRREFSNTGFKHPLTEMGKEQARALALSLSGFDAETIYTSPLMRAVQTAQILADSLHAPVQTTEALCEWSVGTYEGTTDPAGWDLHAQVQDQWFTHGQLDARMPGGESFLDIKRRFAPFIDSLVSEEASSGRSAVLVGHGGLYTAMLPAIFSNVDFPFARQHGFTYTAHVLAETRPTSLHCLSWCGVPADSSEGDDYAPHAQPR